MSDSLKMLSSFPLLIPNKDFTEYNGFFKAGSAEYELHVSLPNAPALSGMIIKNCSYELLSILSEYKNDVEQWKSTSKSFYKFMDWLQKLLVTLNLGDNRSNSENLIIKLKSFYDDLKIIGMDKLKAVDTEYLEWIELKIDDSGDREHILKIKLQGVSPQYEVVLPKQSVKSILKAKNIIDAYNTFECEIMELQPFWEVMNEIDSKCVVLESKASIDDTKRQIQLESGVTLILDVNPYNPLSKPNIKLLGPETKVQSIQHSLDNSEWPMDTSSLFETLQEVLGVTLTNSMDHTESQNSQISSQMSESEMCCVCLLGHDLDQNCEGCNSCFHTPCLKEWLQSVPNNRPTFNRIAGKCPVCQEPISCPI